MNATNQHDADDSNDHAEQDDSGLKAKITGAIDTVKQRIEEYHEAVDDKE